MNRKKSKPSPESVDDDQTSDKDKAREKQLRRKTWDEIEEDWGDWSDGDFDGRDW